VTVAVFGLGLGGGFAFAEDPACARGIAELRRGPGSQFPVSWKVAKYTPFLKHEAKGAYVKVTDQDGEVHWARQKDLTTRHGCVAVRSQVAMLRREPSKSAPPSDLKTADRYTPFKRVESKAEWIRIEDESGRQAWIHESQVWKPMKVNSISF
jgi:SH3-like domain-containing protein